MTIFELMDINNITDTRIRIILANIVSVERGDKEAHSFLLSLCKELIKEAKAQGKINKVNHEEAVLPKHYTSLKAEPAKFIWEHNLDFFRGNIIKYLSRLGNKDSSLDELKKVFFYIDYLIMGNHEATSKEFNK